MTFKIIKHWMGIWRKGLSRQVIDAFDLATGVFFDVPGLCVICCSLKDFEAQWIGWAGVNVADEVGRNALTEALAAEKRCVPVFLDEELVNQYNNGYCNNIVWPLFHYLGRGPGDHKEYPSSVPVRVCTIETIMDDDDDDDEDDADDEGEVF